MKVERVVNDLGKSEKFALGLRDYLDDFAAGQGAKTWKHFDQDWKVTVLERLNNANVKIEFNLTGIDSPWASVSRAARGAGEQLIGSYFKLSQILKYGEELRGMRMGKSS